MPRVSQAEAKQTRQRIIDTSIKIVTLEGYENLTFSNIAKGADISRSGINCHFKTKADLLSEIKPKLILGIESYLDFSTPEDFFNTWKSAVDKDRIFRHLVGCIDYKTGLSGVFAKIKGDEYQVEETTYLSLGYMLYHTRQQPYQEAA